MCGRFTLLSKEEEIENRFQLKLNFSLNERYNIAPTQDVLVITQGENERQAAFYRWGLIPFWAKDQSIGNKMINARAETVDEKPAFRHLLKRKRCLVVANGFFEWKKMKNKKQPNYIHLQNNKPFAFAGLWDVWKQADKQIHSCTIITTSPNELMKSIHERMPVILDQETENTWLDPNITDSNFLKNLLIPYENDVMESYPVTIMVNNPRNDTSENIQHNEPH